MGELIYPLYVGASFAEELDFENGKFIVMDMGSVDSNGYRVEGKKTNKNRDLLQKGDLVMPKDDIGGGQIIGKTAYITKENCYVLGDHVFRIRFKELNSLFSHYYINSPHYNQKIKLCVTGSAQLGLRGLYVENSIINYPNNYDEQSNIGRLFEQIDNLITLHQRECFFIF